MARMFAKELAKKTGLHSNTIRNWCDRGLVECQTDMNGWRWFPDADATVKRIEELLSGGKEKNNESSS